MDRMISTKQAAAKWGCSQASVWEWCRSGLIAGAVHAGPGSCWRIPADAACPVPVKHPPRDGPDGTDI